MKQVLNVTANIRASRLKELGLDPSDAANFNEVVEPPRRTRQAVVEERKQRLQQEMAGRFASTRSYSYQVLWQRVGHTKTSSTVPQPAAPTSVVPTEATSLELLTTPTLTTLPPVILDSSKREHRERQRRLRYGIVEKVTTTPAPKDVPPPQLQKPYYGRKQHADISLKPERPDYFDTIFPESVLSPFRVPLYSSFSNNHVLDLGQSKCLKRLYNPLGCLETTSLHAANTTALQRVTIDGLPERQPWIGVLEYARRTPKPEFQRFG